MQRIIVCDVCRQFMCPISLMLCVLYVSTNVGNNIKREEKMKTKNVTKKCNQNTPTPLFFFILPIRFMLFPTFKKTYNTHKGNRIHELTTDV